MTRAKIRPGYRGRPDKSLWPTPPFRLFLGQGCEFKPWTIAVVHFTGRRRTPEHSGNGLSYSAQVEFALAELFFRQPALRHVLGRADVLQPTVSIVNGVADQVNVLD